jgi:hypothetical protein
VTHLDDMIAAARAVAAGTGKPLTPEEEQRLAEIANIECDRCREVGPEACAAERARFNAEPFLAPCFDLGAQWTSHDDGLTWTRYPVAENGWRGGRKLTVIAIDATRGEVTFQTEPRPQPIVHVIDPDNRGGIKSRTFCGEIVMDPSVGGHSVQHGDPGATCRRCIDRAMGTPYP